MANASELDLFNRSLGGGRRARIELYKKYFRDSSRMQRVAADFPDATDFLHDCFTNLLRGGKTWSTESSLSAWVDVVAAWTAAERDRVKVLESQLEQGTTRLCAETECDDARPVDSYAPPLVVGDDSPEAHMAALLDEPQATVFRKMIAGKGTWGEAAEAAGKPLTAIGPAFCRALGRLSRLTGAPPPIEEDLAPVFERASENPLKPEGRIVTIQLDPLFYEITPAQREIGINISREARTLVLWEAAISPEPPDEKLQAHLKNCHYCAQLLRSFSLLHQILGRTDGKVLLCPSAYSLGTTPDHTRPAFDEHCAQCQFCASERVSILGGNVPKAAAPPKPVKPKGEPSPRKRLAAMAAVLLALIAIPIAAYLYFTRKPAEVPTTATLHSDVPTVAVDPRYNNLVENVGFDEKHVMAAVLPENVEAMHLALRQFSMGDFGQAMMVTEQVVAKSNDPSAHMVYAMCLYRNSLMTDGYREMLKAEAIDPRDPFRCWVMLQFSLMVGDKKALEREVGHLASDPTYGDKAKKVLERVRLRG